MSWECRISHQAAKQLRRVPQDRRGQLVRAIDEMTSDPTAGDVRPIKSGKFKGALRKRVGRYRIIYSVDPERKLIEIGAILVRTSGTYQ